MRCLSVFSTRQAYLWRSVWVQMLRPAAQVLKGVAGLASFWTVYGSSMCRNHIGLSWRKTRNTQSCSRVLTCLLIPRKAVAKTKMEKPLFSYETVELLRRGPPRHTPRLTLPSKGSILISRSSEPNSPPAFKDYFHGPENTYKPRGKLAWWTLSRRGRNLHRGCRWDP
ncbi:hypothetical protein LZ30DRAFT_253838 [Colletotrichum cereale]|nr:hypothetical protein LZ30DRAFT_253838 [Colletotrichum cereale]